MRFGLSLPSSFSFASHPHKPIIFQKLFHFYNFLFEEVILMSKLVNHSVLVRRQSFDATRYVEQGILLHDYKGLLLALSDLRSSVSVEGFLYPSLQVLFCESEGRLK